MNPSETANIWIPAVSGLLGALIGGAISYLTMRQQLRHTSKEARLAREHELKRQVYLDATEGIARSVNYLTNIFFRSDLTIQHLSDIQRESGGWTYRIHVVGALDTIKALDCANESLLYRSLDLMVKRMKWEELRSEAEAIHERTIQVGSTAQQLGEAFQAASAPGAASEASALIPQVAERLLAVDTELAELSREWIQTSKRQDEAQRDMVVAGIEAIAEHGRFLSQAIVHMRRELEIPLDEKEYLVHMDESSARHLARLNELLNQLDQLNKE